jgi:hypothetical protein
MARSTLNSSRSMDSSAAFAFGSPASARFKTAKPFSAVRGFRPTVSAALSRACPLEDSGKFALVVRCVFRACSRSFANALSISLSRLYS